jgi:hypothetical protein
LQADHRAKKIPPRNGRSGTKYAWRLKFLALEVFGA